MTADPDDIATLQAQVADALVDLADLPADDPAADRARHAVRLTRHTLENFWLPALDQLAEQATPN